MSEATINGARITHARGQSPGWGVWWLDVKLDDEVTLTGRQIVKAPGQDFVCTVVSGGPSDGVSTYRLAAGAAGWGRRIDRKAYANDAGVKQSTVLNDAAAACGETIANAPTARIGPHWVRPEGPASRALNAIAPAGWYVNYAGVTQIGAWPETTYAGAAVRTDIDLAQGRVTLATDSLAGLAPGALVEGVRAIDVQWDLTPERLTVTAWGAQAAPKGRRVAALKRLIDQLYPELKYLACYEYRVVSQTGDRFDLQAVRRSTGVPDLTRVPIRTMFGVRADVQPGATVLVGFVNADPARPYIAAGDAPDAPGWMPLFLELGEGPTLGVARQTDAVQAGPFSGAIVFGSARIKAGL